MAAVVLCAVEGPITGQHWRFEQHDTFLFGRAPDCHAQLDPEDGTASRHHFLLEVQPPLVSVRDLGSRNGTYVNGVNIGKGGSGGKATADTKGKPAAPTLLRDGDELKVGHNRFLIRCEGSTESDHVEVHRLDVASLAATERAQYSAEDRPAVATREALDAQASGPVAAIAGFALGARLGGGGMGKVYSATDDNGRLIAVKVLRSRVAESDTSRALFQREIDTLRTLNHPRIVQLLSYGQHGRTHWFAMELCPNGSLESLGFERKFVGDHRPLVRVMLDALEGLAYAHNQGLVHRDCKPANILIDHEHRGKIADFGLAKSFDRAGMAGLTLSGQFAGTYDFMPREQLTTFKTMLPASDVYSAGASLYWALSGHAPVEMTEGVDPLTSVLRAKLVSLETYRPELPRELHAVIARACARDQLDRYDNAGEFLRALAPFA
jgi:pSer/pThr/pTyr-binding forkhead associated (FHA) protein